MFVCIIFTFSKTDWEELVSVVVLNLLNGECIEGYTVNQYFASIHYTSSINQILFLLGHWSYSFTLDSSCVVRDRSVFKYWHCHQQTALHKSIMWYHDVVCYVVSSRSVLILCHSSRDKAYHWFAITCPCCCWLLVLFKQQMNILQYMLECCRMEHIWLHNFSPYYCHNHHQNLRKQNQN